MTELRVELPAGTYVVAVSGGVDSMTLLDVLSKQPEIKVVVAHFHHGIRGQDADRDEQLVRETAAKYGFAYESDFGNLGTGTSEASAREARYLFLLAQRRKHGARGLVLAHHKDDVIETVLINLLRGTGWRGLSSLRSHDTVFRPLLDYEKNTLIAYARDQGLVWHEDASNTDQKYLRNYVRWTLIPQMVAVRPTVKDELYGLHKRQVELEAAITDGVDIWLGNHVTNNTHSRYDLIMLPDEVALEVLQETVRRNFGHRLLHDQIRALLLFVKTAHPGTMMQPGGKVRAHVTQRELIVWGAQE